MTAIRAADLEDKTKATKMLALLIIKYFRLNIRTRLLAGLSVCFILAIIVFIFVSNIFFFDGLSRMASSETVFYLHWNYHAPDNFYRLKTADAILQQFQLADLDRHLLGPELAVICNGYQDGLRCGLAIKTDRAAVMEKYLAAEKITYHRLSRKIFIIGQDEEWLKTIKISRNPLNFIRFQSGAGQYNELTIVLKQPQKLTSEPAKLLYFAGLSPIKKVSGLITGRGILFKPAQPFDIFTSPKLAWFSPTGCDLFFTVAKPGKNILSDFIFSQLTGQIDDPEDLPAVLSGQPLKLCLKKKNNGNNLLTDYEINLQSSAKLTTADLAKIEPALLRLASRLEPDKKSVYLNDGTKVTELFAKPANFSIIRTDNLNSLTLTDGRGLFYAVSSSTGFFLSNNQEQLNKILPAGNSNSIFIRLSALPDGLLQKYLGDFSYLIADDGGLLIK